MDHMKLAQDYLDAVIRQGMAIYRTPAVALAWTDRDTLLHTGAWGLADPAKGITLTGEHLFNFGSIGKSFTCIALLQAQEQGLADLQAPVTRYLPWFEVKTIYRPITLHDLMTHSSGLTQGTDEETEALGEVWNLRHLPTGFPPGEAFYYSNSGYKTLGLVLEKIYGKPYPQIIQEQVLDPLGMQNSIPALTNEAQFRFARAYRPAIDDRPSRLDAPLAPVPWIESATGDGCLSSNAADLATYARMLLNRGRYAHGRLFSEESFTKMTTPYQLRQEERAYGYGMMIWQEEGFHCIGHSGSIPGYLAFMRMDMDNGLGAVLLMTEPVVEEVSELALQALRAAVLGKDLPPNPFEKDRLAVDNAVAYAGKYSGDGRSFEIIVEAGRAHMLYQGGQVTLEPRGEDAFLAWHPDFDRFLLRFFRQAGKESPVVEAFYGGEWFKAAGYSGETAFETPTAWLAYPGHYRSHNPWRKNFRIVLRKGRLMMIAPQGHESYLRQLDDGSFLVEDKGSPVHVERLEFDAVAEGQAIIARLAGANFYRFFTP